MTLRTFLDQCKPGSRVTKKTRKGNDKSGTVLALGKGHDKALVQFEDGYKEWVEYYLLDFETNNE